MVRFYEKENLKIGMEGYKKQRIVRKWVLILGEINYLKLNFLLFLLVIWWFTVFINRVFGEK